MGKDTQILGKQGELFVFSKLLNEGITVYSPFFDVEGIDCIIRTKTGEHIDIQVKTRTDEKLFDVRNLTSRPDFYVICHLAKTEETWVLPSSVFKKYSSKHGIVNRLIINGTNEKELLQYQGDYGFKSLLETTRTGKVKTPNGWEYLKKRYLTKGAEPIRIKRSLKPGTKSVYKRIRKLQKEQGIA